MATQNSGQSDLPPFRYGAELAERIETKWQSRWASQGTYRVPGPGEPGFDPGRPKFYCLDMFPYPSGAGLHVGHPAGYVATDILSRYKRMRGFNVLHPMGWDAFGLPAEQYAIQTGVHPAVTTSKAIANFRRQLQRFGLGYDWSREIATIDPAYYKWTQWIFLQIYNAWYDTEAPAASGAPGAKGRARPIAELKRALESGELGVDPFGEVVRVASGPTAITGTPVGVRRWHELSQEERRSVIDGQRLAYLGEQTVNWCPKLGTALANEEVIDGRSERGGHPVYRVPLKQWMFRITAFAGRLLEDLSLVEWPESTKTMQAEWIGRSTGAEIDFEVEGAGGRGGESLRVYTTRPDTIFGATYMVMAPEHPLVREAIDRARQGIGDGDASAIESYVARARHRSDVDRQADAKEKTGVFSGLVAINPATGGRIPVWIADYVLMGYGHGAIMAVPAHDERDFAFAQRFGLPIRDVVYPRSLAAICWFAREVPPELADGGQWLVVLGDFLSAVVTGNVDPHRFRSTLVEVAARARAERGGTTCDVDPEVAASELPGMASRRGVSRMTWIEAVEGLGIKSLEDLRARAAAGDFHARSGVPWSAGGFMANSSGQGLSLDGLGTEEAKARTVEWLESRGVGRGRVNYRLRDWLFSRQRYWGEPFPIVFDGSGNHYAVREEALPVRLPDLADYQPVESLEPLPLLAKATAWVHTTAGQAGVDERELDPLTPVRRETNTMPGWAGSCWYYLRFCDPSNDAALVGREAERYWMGGRGVDLYVGGSEHAVLHLLYARFWHKALFDLGHVSTPEPFGKLFHQGLITSMAYQRADKSLVAVDQVEERPAGSGRFVERGTGESVTAVIAKMSKSLKNVVNPDDVIAEYGADTFRLYEMYMGPLEASKPWNPRDIAGCFRFLQRLWRLCVDERTGELRLGSSPDAGVERGLHRLVKKVGDDVERLSFNTAIAAMMGWLNDVGQAALTRGQMSMLTRVVAPFTPHLAEELWEKLGLGGSVVEAPWPAHDASLLVDDRIEIPVQVGGKVRARIMVESKADAGAMEAAALAEPKVQEALAGKSVKKVIVVPGKMVNIVAG